MFHLTLFAIASLTLVVFLSILIVIILLFAKTKTHYLWALFNVVVVGWGLGLFFVGLSKTPERALLFWKLAYIPGTFISVVFCHLVFSLINLPQKKFLIFAYVQGFLFTAIFLSTHLFNAEIHLIFNSIYYHTMTPLFNAWFVFWLIVTFKAFYELFHFMKIAEGEKKTQAAFLFYCMGLGFLGGTASVLPAYGIMIYPALHFTISVYMAGVTYGMFRYKLMDITIAVNRSLVYSILITILTALYFLFIVFAERLFQHAVGYNSFLNSLLIILFFTFVSSPLKNRIQYVVDKLFFKGTVDEIAEQNELLRREVAQKEKFKAVATLASGIAHEVRNPLTAIKTYFEYFPQKKDDPKFLENYNRIASKEIDRIESLVQKLLDFAKPSPPNLQKVQIHKIIEDTLSLLEAKAREHHVKVVCQFAPTDIILQADANQMKQALLNVMQNAIEAMSTGGVLTVGTSVDGVGFSGVSGISGNKIHSTNSHPNSKIVKPLTPTGRLLISIKDSGAGIARDKLPHIFDAFYTSKDSGTGLGLAITQSIVEEHGGKIRVESEMGKGTEFIIELPCQ